jgi:prepilin peptidase CpaA
MQVQHLMMCLPLVVLLIWAAASDLRTRRIPNWLTFTVVLTGLIQSITSIGVISFGQSLAGLAVGFALPLLVYALGGLGAGDVKLLAGVGAWLGPKNVLLVFLAAALVGLVLILVQCAIQGRLAALFRNTGGLLVELIHVRHTGAQALAQSGRQFKSIDRPLPYAVHLLIGTIGVIAMPLASKAGGL